MHVVVIADSRFPLAEPFAGGLQSMTWHLVRGMRARGVRVTVFAGPGTDPSLDAQELAVQTAELSPDARSDVSMQPEEWLTEHHAYLQLMLELARRRDVDVVHNNTLHHLPIAMAEMLSVPVVTTLHTPPTPWLEPVVRLSEPGHNHFVAVSEHTARQWHHVVDADVVLNGVDTARWPCGPGGEELMWFGRIVPEKAPHLAIDIARRCGLPLRLAGPVSDPAYWRREVEPRLGDGVRYLGHLCRDELAEAVGGSAAVLVTPMWEEPYGLVGAEAVSCGTPVVGFDRGGLREVLDGSCARLVPAGDVAAAAAAVAEVLRLPRSQVRAHAERSYSMDAVVDAYLDLFTRLRLSGRAA